LYTNVSGRISTPQTLNEYWRTLIYDGENT
jgi:hypothetical protein